jgi:hypothetical protein
MSGVLGGVDGAVRSWMANRKQSSLRAAGGTLSLMPESLLFKPNAVDAALAGQTWHVHLSQIRAVGREEANVGDFFNGGLRSRLRVDLWDGSAELFVVWSLDEVISTLNSYLEWFRQQQGQPVSAQVCAGCGKPLAPAHKFCGQCGRPAGA